MAEPRYEIDESKQKKWYKRKELWGSVLTVVSFTPEIINSFSQVGLLSEHTVLAKLALPIGLILTLLGLRKGFKAQNLLFQRNAPTALPEGLRQNPFKTKDDYIGE